MIDENKINTRIQVLESDVQKVQKDLQTLEQKKAETTALLNALLGANNNVRRFYKSLVMMSQILILTLVM